MNAGSVKRAFTMVEVLVALFLLGVGIVACMGALTGLERAEIFVQQRDRLSRLAHDKLDELLATEGWRDEAGGSFDDPRLSDVTWTATSEETGTENVVAVRVTVIKGTQETHAETLVYEIPETTGGTTP